MMALSPGIAFRAGAAPPHERVAGAAAEVKANVSELRFGEAASTD
jgi:hypothetical protein